MNAAVDVRVVPAPRLPPDEPVSAPVERAAGGAPSGPVRSTTRRTQAGAPVGTTTTGPPDPAGGACGPTVERLGPARMAVYSHAPPGAAHLPQSAPRAVHASAPGQHTGGAGTLDVRQACCMVAVAAVEVLAGIRPLAQLARWLTPETYDALARRAALTVPRGGHLDPLAERGVAPAGSHRPSVRRVRVCPVTTNVVEASVVIGHAGRVRAVAVRLTRASGRWRASALVIG